MKVGDREFVETVCVFCDMTFFVPKGMEKDYVCLDCRDFFKREMMDRNNNSETQQYRE